MNRVNERVLYVELVLYYDGIVQKKSIVSKEIKMEDDFDKHANLIIDGLYLGSEEAAQVDYQLLEKRKITHICIPAFTGKTSFLGQ